jgi:methylated-DNA-[protein]-cysteine S-methyltransferase
MAELAWAGLDTPVGRLSVGCTPVGVSQVRFGSPPRRAAASPPAGPGAAAGPPAGPGAAAGPPAGPGAMPGPPAGPGAAAGPPAGPGAMPGPPAGPGAMPGPPAGPGAAAGPPADAVTQLAEYFSGRRRSFDLPLDWSGMSRLQRRVLGVLFDSVGYGETVSYGTLARRVQSADGSLVPARAIGQVMGSNPIPLIVPCHRVVAADGLGGYSGGTGLEVKRWLLTFEGALPPTLDWEPTRLPA